MKFRLVFSLRVCAIVLLLGVYMVCFGQFVKPLKKAVVILDGKVLPVDFNYDRLNPDSIQKMEVFKSDSISKLTELAQKYEIETKNGVVVITTKRFERLKNLKIYPNSKTPGREVLTVVEKLPTFVGGNKALLEFINKNLHYPTDAQIAKISGTVILRFIVTKEGKVEDVELLRGLCPSIDEESIRVASLIPDFIPGEQNGVKVNVYYCLPIVFKLK